MSCPQCGQQNPPDHKFCGNCGRLLTPVDGAYRTSARASYTPLHLAEKILTRSSALEGERKQVTVLFCDIADSTILAEQIGAEHMHKVLDAFFELALEEVHEREGTVNQFLGDGFMALFGAPITHEDHARRAVLAALAIRQAIATRLSSAGVPPPGLSVRMGLNTGAVVVGKIGDNLRMDYTAVGDTTNVAARVQSLAEPGQILLTDATLRAVESYVECRALGRRQVKGKSEPIAIHEILQARSAEKVRTERLARPALPLIGRDQELGEFEAGIRLLHQGQGGLILVLGEAGLGKSRLVAEVRRKIEPAAITWLEGAALSFGRTLSYWPFLEMLKGYFQLAERDAGEAAFAKLESKLAELYARDKVEEVLPYLATLLALPLSREYAERTRYLDGLGMGSQVFRTIRGVLQRLSIERPLVLVFEDWHWADTSSVELLEHLLPMAFDHPVLFCVCTRNDESAPVRRVREAAQQIRMGQLARILTLQPLDGDHAGALAHQLLGARPLSAIARELLVRVASGNPFFLEELIKASMETGALNWDTGSGEWVATADLADLRVPDTLQGVIMARIDRLDEGVRHVLRMASVIGRSFFYRVLREVTDTDAQTDRDLGVLVEIELIQEKQRFPELEYLFKHALVQEATYDSMLADRRRQLHLRVGIAIEQVMAARLPEFYPVLAYHFAKAENWERAQEYLFKAGDQAGDVAGDDEAVEHYRMAMAAHERAFGDRWAPLQRASLYRKMGEALFRIGDHKRALSFLTDALTHLGRPYPASQTAVRVAMMKQLIKRMVGAVWARRRDAARRPATADAEAATEAFRIILALGWIHVFQDSERMALDTFLVAAYAEESADAGDFAIGLGYIGLLFNILGMHGLADRYHQRAAPLAGESKNPMAIGHTCFSTGMGHYYAGRWDEALASCERSAGAFRSIGHYHLWGGPRSWCAFALQAKGEARGAEVSEELELAGRETRDRELEAWGLLASSVSLRQAGNYDAAIRKNAIAARIFESIPDPYDLACVTAEAALCHAYKGAFEMAIPLAAEALASLRERGPKGFWAANPHAAAAETYVLAADRMQTDTLTQHELLRMATRLARVAVKNGRLVRNQWAPEAQRLLGICHWLAGDRKKAQRCWVRAAVMAERLGAKHTLAQIFLEMGRRLQKAPEIERAAELFTEGGFSARAAEARVQLAMLLRRTE